jgi:hypothetical protein
MPNLRPLDALRARLRAELDPQHIFQSPGWADTRVMTEALRIIKRDLGGNDGGEPTQDVLQESLQRFADTRQVANFTELKYVCYGVTVPLENRHWRVIDSEPLFNDLIGFVRQRESQPKQFRRCYQGLLSGYFGFDRHVESKGSGPGNWNSLRGFLGDSLRPMLKASTQRGTTPDWVRALDDHRNLLTEDACSRYAKGLLRDDPSELKTVCEALGVASNSWVWEETLMTYVRLVCEYKDLEFKRRLPNLLKLVDGQMEMKLPDMLASKAVAMAVARYSHCEDRVEHTALRDRCLRWIGNPWLQRAAWDAQVNHEPARKMVESWLKRRLIKDFFELLAHDGSADLRRLNYWLKWEPQITDMWFVLGTDARNNHSAPFLEVRKRMSGQDRFLSDNNHLNNAFVMRIGQLLVIEFGVTDNACYVFAAADFHTSLEQKTFSIHELKQKAQAKRLSHISQWEGKFDYELKRLLQSVPMSKGRLRIKEPPLSARPEVRQAANESVEWEKLRESVQSPAAKSLLSALGQRTAPLSTTTGPRKTAFTDRDFIELRAQCVRHKIEWEDHRPKKGALWVLLTERHKRPSFAAMLEQHGFKYAEGKGFWLKGES